MRRMRVLLRLRPDVAPGLLAGMVQANLIEIKQAGLGGATPVIDGLFLGAELRAQGIFPKTAEWTNIVQAARANGTTIPIYYERLDNEEDWKDWERLIEDGFGDCEDLATAVAAELLACGIPAAPFAYQALPDLWHVIVVYHDRHGRELYRDPSRLGGMAGAA